MRQLAKLSCLSIGISLGASTVALGHGGDTTKIHSCVNNATGTIKIVAPNATCKANETPLDWDQTAPPAPPFSTRMVINAVTLPGDGSGDQISVSASCAANEWLTGGGFDQTGPVGVTPLDVQRSGPATEGSSLGNGWTARARNRTNADQELKVFAVCATSTP